MNFTHQPPPPEASWFLLGSIAHPGSGSLPHLLLEGFSESGVISETTLLRQLLDSKGALGSDCFTVETDEVLDAQAVYVGIISRILPLEVQAEVTAIGADSLAEVADFNIVPQIELCSLNTSLQQEVDVGRKGGRRHHR